MLNGKNSKFYIKFGSVLMIYFLVLAGFSGIFIFGNDSLKVMATTHYVGGSGPGNYSTIQAAINAASPEDTVYVYSGTYYENVIINKTLNLIGENRSNTTVIGNSTAGNGTLDVIQVAANHVLIKGFSVKNSGNSHLAGGIKLQYANHCSIIGNNVSSNGYSGIILLTSKNNIIKDNIISYNNGTGLMLRYSSTHNTIINNSIDNNCLNNNPEAGGLFILFHSNHNAISKNSLNNNNQNGILSFNSNNNLMKQNTISNNKNGILFGQTNKDMTIYLNEFVNNTNHVVGSSSSRTWNSQIKITYLYNNTNFTNFLGNYWDDYTGNDANNDGIGDTPYNIGIGSEQDLYPLVDRIANYTIIPSSTHVNLVATYSNVTNKTVTILIHNATLNASISGDFNGSINFANLKLVVINSSSFAGKGFFISNWTATIEGKLYDGIWQGMLFNISGERKYYMKGTLFGGLMGITDGYLVESSNGSGVYNVFNSTSTIYRLGEHITFAQLNLNGTMNYHSLVITTSEIYILQALFTGNATGFYNKSLSVVLTHIRINNQTHQYYGKGFSTMSYISTWGSGSGWTYDRIIEPHITNLTGFFTPPLWGIVFGILNETGPNRTLSITILRLDLGRAPAAIVQVDVWGPSRATPGQKIYYLIEYKNIGLKNAYNTEIVLVLSNNVTYLNNTGNGIYNNNTKEVTWRINISAKSRNIVSVKCRLKWGLILGSYINCTGLIRDYVTNTTLANHSWSILVVVAIDPNQKSGPDGDVSQGQTLNYRIEFENEGEGIAYGVYFTDTLSKYLDDSTLKIGPVFCKSSGAKIAPPGIYDPGIRTITWFAGEVGPGKGGYANLSIKVRKDAIPGSEIINYGIVYFPSVPEITKTNGVVSIVIANKAPVAKAGFNMEVDTLEHIVFDGSKSYDLDGTIISYLWDFGDGTYGYNKVDSHTYLDDGDYSVTLTVTDDVGASNSHQINVRVKNRVPIARLEVDSKDVKTKEVIFNAEKSSDLDGQVIEYYFDFGDGSNSGWINTPNVGHIYSDVTELYTVKLTVKDNDGDINDNIAELELTIDDYPIPRLSVSPDEAHTYSDILCSGELSTDSDGQIGSYYFDFGDGTSSGWITTPTTTHQYTDGTKKYTISLTVKDNYGAISTEISSAEVLIKNRKPVPSLIVDNLEIYVLDELIFDASGSYDEDGEILEYYFDFGDGTNSGWTLDSIVKHEYRKVREGYSIELMVKDDDGEIETTTLLITFTNRAPYANAGLDQTVMANQPLNFDGRNSYDPDGNILTYHWDYGDGITSGWLNTPESMHSYTTSGDYIVTLTVSDGTLTAKDTCYIYVKADELKKDSDGDGVPDHLDAFPNDAAASVDSDGDHYPDYWNDDKSVKDSETGLTIDEYPNDPDRHEKSISDDGGLEFVYLVALVLLIIILIIGITISIMIKNKNKRMSKPYDSHEFISQVRDGIIQGELQQEPEMSDAELWADLKLKYQKGQITEETYRLLEEEKKQYVSSFNEK